jgi:hypothetical protein
MTTTFPGHQSVQAGKTRAANAPAVAAAVQPLNDLQVPLHLEKLVQAAWAIPSSSPRTFARMESCPYILRHSPRCEGESFFS